MTVVDEVTIEVVKNEYLEIRELVTDKVQIRRLPVKEGSLVLLEITVNAPTYYITGPGDTHPKPTDSIVFFVDVKNGFPKVKPYVYYAPGKILASVNAFTTGAQCIDAWNYDAEYAGNNSTLAGTVRKTIMDIIHDPSVTRYDSMANSTLEIWQKEKTASGEFPTCSLHQVFRDETHGGMRKKGIAPALPVRPAIERYRIPPALPTR